MRFTARSHLEALRGISTSCHNKKGVIITGAARRIGRAMAIFLAARHGYDVVAHYHNSHDEALSLQEIIRKYGRECFLFRADLRHTESPGNLIQWAFSVMPHCNTIINNASVFYASSLKNCTLEALEENYKMHIRVPIFLMQSFVAMRPVQGKILNIIDANVDRSRTKYFAYMVSKKALASLTELAASELAQDGICVNALCPHHIPDDEIDNVGSAEEIDKAPQLKKLLEAAQTLIDSRSSITGRHHHLS